MLYSLAVMVIRLNFLFPFASFPFPSFLVYHCPIYGHTCVT